MKDNFSNALLEVLKSEGEWSDNPFDPGGATMCGITLGTYRDYENNQSLTKEDLRKISKSKIAEIYKERYWRKIKGDELPTGLDYAIFDFAVHSGPGQAARCIQEVVEVVRDGDIGPKTLSAIRRADIRTLIDKYCDIRISFLKRLNMPYFIKGWLKRVENVRYTAKQMCKFNFDVYGKH